MKHTGKISKQLAISIVIAVSTHVASARQTDVPALDSFPEMQRIWMGIEEGVIRPAAHQQVRTNSAGYIKFHAPDRAILEKDAHWATIDPTQIELETRSLELEKARLERKLTESRRNRIEANHRLRLEIHELERGRAEFLFAADNQDVPPALRARALEAVTEADERIEELHELLDPAELELAMELEQEEGELQIERKQRQLHTLRQTSELKAGFAGELRITDPVAKQLEQADGDSNRIWIGPNELIATIVDDARYEISITATSPLLAQIPQEDLLAFFEESRSGRLIEGRFERMVEIDGGSEITRNYIFSIEDRAADDARNSVGQRNLIHIFRRFSEPCRLVQKKDIAFLAPEILEAGGWSALVTHLWPHSIVLQVGPQTIAVRENGEN